MSETKALPPPQSPAPPRPRRDIVPWLYGAGFCVLAVGLIWLWQHPAPPPPIGRVDALEQRLARLEQPSAPPVADLRPLESRLAALEQKPPPATDLRPLESRLAALEQKTPSDTRPLDARLTALEQRPAPDAAALSARMDALAGRQDALAARTQGIETSATTRLDALEPRLTAAEQAAGRQKTLESRLDALERRLARTETLAGQLPALAERAARLARLHAAQTALEDGRALGEIAGAPPALARFATTDPPTEAALRLAFPAAARAALEASVPATADAPLLERLWTRAQSVVTIRQGDRVILGDPAAGTIGRARRTLEAGDLAGAVAALSALQGPAVQEMSAWRAQAQALLDARAALAELAARP